MCYLNPEDKIFTIKHDIYYQLINRTFVGCLLDNLALALSAFLLTLEVLKRHYLNFTVIQIWVAAILLHLFLPFLFHLFLFLLHTQWRNMLQTYWYNPYEKQKKIIKVILFNIILSVLSQCIKDWNRNKKWTSWKFGNKMITICRWCTHIPLELKKFTLKCKTSEHSLMI